MLLAIIENMIRFKYVQCVNKNSHQLDKNTGTKDSVDSDDTEGACQTSLSTLCSDTALLGINDVSDESVIVPIDNPEGYVETGVLCQYSFDDFEPIKVIGRGSYAKVLMVELKQNQRVYAMKVIKKELGKKHKNNNWIQTEKDIFKIASEYPFLVALHSCFQTVSRFCFVMEFARGGDLLNLMQEKRRLSEDHGRFYAAEISLALNFLHTRGIIYRDLKLENILLDHEGHIKLTDYGMCKQGKRRRYTTFSILGTANYVAPEVLKYEDYGLSVDWWSLGILLFEMLVGKSPFGNSDIHVFQDVLTRPLRIPKSLSVEAASVLMGFLNKNPSYRLGCDENNGFCGVKHHLFFKSVDWEMLEQKKVVPCYIPQLNSDRDFANFPTEFTDQDVACTPDNPDSIYHVDLEGFEYVNPNFRD
ncbi:atypical protein kinase C-like [Myzus persicae]|uniref:atypical protein kinase C-like n=1 Tax=Myzus persicae TaxID=13164 RepID=UPI000B93727B|nr:atypical protein kinase C-like [Myzus persicae]